jgi:hypothetical protein
MKTSILTLAIALAFSFTAVPADAATDLEKCRVYNAKIKMNYAKCLELDNLLVEKGKAAKGVCDSKRTASLEKATAKFVIKLGVGAAECGIDTDTAAADQALQWLASGDGSLTAEQEAALAGTAADITSDNASLCTDAGGTYDAGTDTCSVDITSDIAAAEQAGCEAANGTWDGSVCTPADRDCFREGACGVDGWNQGAYAETSAPSDCPLSPCSSGGSYNCGLAMYQANMASPAFFFLPSDVIPISDFLCGN